MKNWVMPAKWEVVELSLEEIKGISEFNVRKTWPTADIELLANSIKASGVNIAPIVIDEENRVIAGQRRYLAAKRAGVKTIICMKKPMTQVEKMVYSIIENTLRLDLLPKDKYEWAKSMIDKGFKVKQIAEIIGVEPQTIYNWLSWDVIPEVVKEAKMEQPFKELTFRKKQKLHDLMKREPFKSDVKASMDLLNIARKGETHALDEVKREISLGLKPSMDMYKKWPGVKEQQPEERLKYHEIRIPAKLEQDFSKVLKLLGKGFQEGIIDAIKLAIETWSKALWISS